MYIVKMYILGDTFQFNFNKYSESHFTLYSVNSLASNKVPINSLLLKKHFRIEKVM